MQHLLIYIIALFVIAAVLRVDFFFYVLYFLFGVYFLAGLWLEHVLRRLTVMHTFERRAFCGERVTVTLQVRNASLLPLPWLRLHESAPVMLRSPNFFRCVLSMWPRETRTLSYDLDCRRRGYYPLGPLTLGSGDLLGVRSHERRMENVGALIVYPQIVPLSRIELAAQTPLGDVPSHQRLYEDPTRMTGVRPYVSGDSLRHIHWKTSAATGALQVKRFEPAISWEALILLNMRRTEYSLNRYVTASELGITTAASLAHFLAEKRQQVGLSCNGLDPLAADEAEPHGGQLLTPRKGRDQLMRILDVLARVQLAEDGPPFIELVRAARLHLGWGGTAIVVTGHADEELLSALLMLQRAGFHLQLIVTDPRAPFADIQARAQAVGIRTQQIWRESDLDVWR